MELDLDRTGSIDILNISHDDVLQLYRGWRRSEAQLKDKSKELTTLRKRMEQLQEAHVKFHGQIQALKAVKELTVNLQTQLSSLQQENIQLEKENNELKTNVTHLEVHVSETVTKSQTTVRDTQIDQAILRGRCQELQSSVTHTVVKLEEEQAHRISSEKRLENSEQMVESLRAENQSLKDQLGLMTQRVTQCDNELAIASNQLSTLSKEVSCISQTQERLVSAEAETGVLKGDISRLIHLLEHNRTAQGFVSHWKDSGGMTFIGLNRKKSRGHGENSEDQHDFSDLLSSVDSRSLLPEEDDEEDLISPSEYAHLQRMYGGDPFPMTASFTEEAEHWAPKDVVKQGLHFVEMNMPHISRSVITEFIATMNKIWMRREKRKISRVKDRYEKILEELDRKHKNKVPYQEVIAVANVKRLQSQVREKRGKFLNGRPKKFHELSKEERNFFDVSDEFGDLDSLELGGHDGHKHNQRLCQVPPKGTRSHIKDLSTNKLLVASLESLETIGRQQMSASSNSHNQSMTLRGSMNGNGLYSGPNSPKRSLSPRRSVNQSNHSQEHPSEEYLRGALWLGRNFVSVVEELCSSVESVRLRTLKDIALATSDSDIARTSHRLALLLNSIITEYTSMVLKASYKGREMLQGAASIQIGDLPAYERFLHVLPIESHLVDKGNRYIGQNRLESGNILPSSPRQKPTSPFKRR